MPPSHLLGVVLALISAASWGGGDFSGGRAARRHNAIQVLALAALASLAVLIVLALLWGEFSLTPESVSWSAAAGVSGALGTVLLYRGLACAAAPQPWRRPPQWWVRPCRCLFTALSQGLPGGLQLAGFAAGLGGIALVSRSYPACVPAVPAPITMVRSVWRRCPSSKPAARKSNWRCSLGWGLAVFLCSSPWDTPHKNSSGLRFAAVRPAGSLQAGVAGSGLDPAVATATAPPVSSQQSSRCC